MTDEKIPFDQWCVLELMGKVRLGGRVREEQVFNVSMIRIDIPADKEGNFKGTRYFHPNALYGITPVTQEVATAVALYQETPVVNRWEMKELNPGDESTIRDTDDSDYDFAEVPY